MATVGSGVVLIVGAGTMRAGTFGVGDLAIFLTYLPRLTSYMAFVGDWIAQHRRTGVAFDRMRALAVDAPDSYLLDRTPVPLAGEVADPVETVSDAEPFESLEVEGLSFAHTDGAMGVSDVSFRVAAGEFVVFTGKIGSGKSSLLRAVLGLVPAQGTWRWNGREIADPAAFLVPPRTAYTSQVPRLFSDSLANNIALGRRVPRERMREAISLAVLDPDVERLEGGLDTAIGARGVKLSGGQVQRSAAARMFATEAQLLVFDDLSSALDVHTEGELWNRLFSRRDVTCLVVSHRRSVLQRADRILVLNDGVVADQGSLDELLERSQLMRDLWTSAA
jgi:ATP-binding cassette subfamily B protein/ATP-binding cassette subfamily C protein